MSTRYFTCTHRKGKPRLPEQVCRECGIVIKDCSVKVALQRYDRDNEQMRRLVRLVTRDGQEVMW